jgi:tripartite-type tricarboxylate transporter receptor subunit TctC
MKMGSMAGRALSRAVAVAFIVATPLSIAQQNPIHALRVVVPFALGGSTGVLARIMGQRLAEDDDRDHA